MKNRDSLLKSAYSIHDQTQIEFVFDYKLGALLPEKQQNKGGAVFDVEAYFYFPQQMNVLTASDFKQQFYDDIRPLFRVKEPRYKDFFNPSDKKSGNPLLVLRDFYTAYKSNSVTWDLEKNKYLILQVRLFALLHSSYLLKRVEKRARAVKEILRVKEEENKLLNEFTACSEIISRGYKLKAEFFQLAEKFREEKIFKDLICEFNLSLEYVHFRFMEALVKLAVLLQEVQERITEQAFLCGFENQLRSWLRLHHYWGKKRGYLEINENSSSKERQAYFFRQSELKKRMSHILYLELEPRAKHPIRGQLGPMLAAGIAASWAFFANLLIFYYFKVSGISDIEEQGGLITSSSVAVVLAFIFAYILKDRIKDLGKERLREKLKEVKDYHYKVWFTNSSGERVQLGEISEGVSFFENTEQVANFVKEKRSCLPSNLVSYGEKIICYEQQLEIDPKIYRNYLREVGAVRNILRFKINRYLDYLDGSTQKHAVLDRKGKIQFMIDPKVYHLDVVLRYRLTSGDNSKILGTDIVRLVINKDGIIGIEKL